MVSLTQQLAPKACSGQPMAVGDYLSTIPRSFCPQLLLFLTPLYSLSPVCFALFPVASLPFSSLLIQVIHFF